MQENHVNIFLWVVAIKHSLVFDCASLSYKVSSALMFKELFASHCV